MPKLRYLFEGAIWFITTLISFFSLILIGQLFELMMGTGINAIRALFLLFIFTPYSIYLGNKMVKRILSQGQDTSLSE